MPLSLKVFPRTLTAEYTLPKTLILAIILLLQLCLFQQAYAKTRIAVLDFELKDMTLVPRIPAELERTRSIKPLLEENLRKAGYEIINIDSVVQQQANSVSAICSIITT